jgi:hypothetical protein
LLVGGLLSRWHLRCIAISVGEALNGEVDRLPLTLAKAANRSN